MICAPDHVKKYVRQIVGKNKFFDNNLGNNEFAFDYEVVCSCGSNEFAVYKNAEPKAACFCKSCGKEITLYDLTEYPCAVVVRKEEEVLEKVTNGGNDKFNVAVRFEYSDEFAFDDDEFDENGITWCQIYIYDPEKSQSIMIVDDETA